MKITITFDSIAELEAFRTAPARKTLADAARETREAAELPQETPKPAKAKRPAKPAPEPVGEEPAPEEELYAKVPTLPEAREALVKLNGLAGRNRAAEIIREIADVPKLTQVTDPEQLALIYARAREEAAAYAD